MNKNLPKHLLLSDKEEKKVDVLVTRLVKAYFWHIIGIITGFIIILLWWALK